MRRILFGLLGLLVTFAAMFVVSVARAQTRGRIEAPTRDLNDDVVVSHPRPEAQGITQPIVSRAPDLGALTAGLIVDAVPSAAPTPLRELDTEQRLAAEPARSPD